MTTERSIYRHHFFNVGSFDRQWIFVSAMNMRGLLKEWVDRVAVTVLPKRWQTARRRRPLTLFGDRVISLYISDRITSTEISNLESRFSESQAESIPALQEEIVGLYSTAFHRAAKFGDLKRATEILSAIEEKAHSLSPSTPSSLIDSSGRVFQPLINHEDILDSSRTPLLQAAARGHLEMVSFLITECHADIFSKDNEHESTVIHLAAQNGHVQVVDFLLEQNKELLVTVDKHGDSALNTAALCGRLAIVELLINKHHCDPNFCNSHGFTPVMQAAQKGHLQIVSWLAEKAADLLAQENGNMGDTAIHLAAAFGHCNVVEFLVRFSPQLIEVKNDAGLDALSYARLANQWPVVRLLESIVNSSTLL